MCNGAWAGKYREGFDFEEYNKIVAAMQELKGVGCEDDEVRIVVFFDN
jgi:hypothetical protein